MRGILFDKATGLEAHHISSNISLFKVNNTRTRQRCEICSSLTTETLERRQRQIDRNSIVELGGFRDFNKIFFSENLSAVTVKYSN